MSTVKINAKYGYAQIKPEWAATMKAMNDIAAGTSRVTTYMYGPRAYMYCKKAGPLWHTEIAGEEANRWFLRKGDVVAYLVGLRMQRDDVFGIEEALKTLE